MKDSHRPEPPRSRVKTGKKNTLFFIIGLVVVLTCSVLLIMNKNRLGTINIFDHKGISTSTEQQQATTKLSDETPKTFDRLQTKPLDSPLRHRSLNPGAENVSIQSDLQKQEISTAQNQADIQKAETTIATKNPRQQIKSDANQQLVDDLNAFYAHLDQQPYMQNFQLKETSKNHFSKLLQVLIDNPPTITRETDDYFTLLKNTAHFFRVLGKDNILVLKGILDREKDSFERILKTFYALTDHPVYLKEEFSLSIPPDNLYDYAGFFLNTIGGRLYLFRRDSASRMTISYYSVMIIDKANKKGNSRLGIDLRPAIDLLIEEIENTGTKLKFREEYLDTLYDLKENYSNRG